jgi:hypothetical protein
MASQLTSQAVVLFKPQDSYRIRWSMYTDTPVPQEEAAGENPPDGAMIDYYLNEKATNITLEIVQANFSAGSAFGSIKVLRTYSNHDTLYKIGDVNIPHYWIRPQQILSANPGHHRFMWDMKYEPLNLPPAYPISATYMNTVPDQTSPWAMPGEYAVKLTVDGNTTIQPFILKMDPRVKTSVKDIQGQHELSYQCYVARKECMTILEEIRQYRSMLKGQMTNPQATVADELNKKDKLARELEATAQGSTEPSFGRLNSGFASVFSALQDSDMPPTTQMISAARELKLQLELLKKKWKDLRK